MGYVLPQEIKDFRNKSLTENQIVKRAGAKFAREILLHVKPTVRYWERRYLLSDIGKYLGSTKEGKDVFVELVGGQSCFLPPVNKHRQGKLFIKS
jgi:hypothetical protein